MNQFRFDFRTGWAVLYIRKIFLLSVLLCFLISVPFGKRSMRLAFIASDEPLLFNYYFC